MNFGLARPRTASGSPGGLRAASSLQECRESRGASIFMSRHRILAYKSLPSVTFALRAAPVAFPAISESGVFFDTLRTETLRKSPAWRPDSSIRTLLEQCVSSVFSSP